MNKAELEWSAIPLGNASSTFSAADLHLIADSCSDPLTRAIRNNALGWRSPDWSDETCQALMRIGDGRSDSVAVAIRRGTLRFVERVDWSLGLSAIGSVFALHRRLHLFRSETPVGWVEFTEPQLTKGLAHFLDAPDPTLRKERVCALLKALGAMKLSNDNDINSVKVTAEAPTSKRKRIDLLIEWQDSMKERYAVAIEAKLGRGHDVTPGQLPSYRDYLDKKMAIPSERRWLVVVSPRLTRRTDQSLQRNQEWRWAGWHGLLVAHERSLRDEHDNPEYAGFRRTLWDQTG